MNLKKRGKGRKGSLDSDDIDCLLQPCCIEHCDRYGTRLLSSLRDEYNLKPEHSGRVCEGHYRRDLRSYKRKHSSYVPNIVSCVQKKACNAALYPESVSHTSTAKSPPKVFEDNFNPKEHFNITTKYNRPLPIDICKPLQSIKCKSSLPIVIPKVEQVAYDLNDDTMLPAPIQDFQTRNRDSMIVDEGVRASNRLEEIRPRVEDKKKFLLPSISQLCSSPGIPSGFAYIESPSCARDGNGCNYEHENIFKQFCNFVLKTESAI
ncbi:hypothetical protein AKO1_008194 [Acrasis kona]|uniref:Uncharacterized protein n=1 Tax=Acrasis kona TaxID=1008807 RepID=A0AAW2YKE8_9EUKA